jgi:ubiquinone/menaquinone biosynthesis C-methylase UbiE
MARATVGDRLFAAVYERMAASESETMLAWRRWLGRQATGVVVEIGAGTGANLSFLGRADRIAVVEPSPSMRARLAPLAAEAGAELVDASADDLPFDDASVDAVLCTLVLCSVSDLPAALAELRRVLRPGGRLLLLEHVRSDDPRTAAWQDRAVPVWRRAAQGCHPNRDTLAAVEAAGFAIAERHPVPVVMPGARFVPHVAAVAVR